ncbi:MAG: HD domain-containing protein [Desulfobacteraceae bacterium]|nr:HD domain-containing protein [Desulfobacteraceae bacterium]
MTVKEKEIIENHAIMTKKILQHVPFPKGLTNVPVLASSHHEKPNGKGYPDHLKDNDIPLQSKIMAIADIFEALTAEDRPYKRGLSPEEAMKILGQMKEKNEIDPDLFDLCKKCGIFSSRPE